MEFIETVLCVEKKMAVSFIMSLVKLLELPWASIFFFCKTRIKIKTCF